MHSILRANQFALTADVFGLTDRVHRRSRPAPAPSDRNKTADPPIPSENNVADPESSLSVGPRSRRVSTNLRSIFRRVRAHRKHQRRAECRRKYQPDLLAQGSPPEADRAKFARASPQCRNQLRRHRTIFGSGLHLAAVFVEAAYRSYK